MHSSDEPIIARAVLRDGYRTADIASPGTRRIGTRAMGEAVVEALRR